ncbi:hypothetical protein [Xanthomonas prunicola]|uniref:hypothetical protein n=1 Tax=Xanthomonas prunicola TaxID=2053930 RepID=UPI001054FBDD|nr:hypothetical protein [Xanthomonas prunicola]
MAPHVNAMIASVDLICPPIANSSVSQISKNKNVVKILRLSDFYMIGGRAKAIFSDVHADDEGRVHFEIQVQGGASDKGFIDTGLLPPVANINEEVEVTIGVSDISIIFCKKEKSGTRTVVASFHPEDLLWRRGRAEEFIGGLEKYLELASYDLLYVGKATGTDSFDRLLKKGHDARQKIVSDEPQRYPGAHVSDEIYLFLFKVEPLIIKSWRPEDVIEDKDVMMSYSNSRLVSDAEKAFVSLLKPKYNNELYRNYPKGKDGIYNEGYTGYSYSLSDGLVFRTNFGSMKGARERGTTMSNDADFISIKGESVKLHIAGVDYELDASCAEDGTPVSGPLDA